MAATSGRLRMKKLLRAYSSIITRNISLFLAVGFLNILFSEHGWMPIESIGHWNSFLYEKVIPLALAFTAGQRAGGRAGQREKGNMGGMTGVLAISGLAAVCEISIIFIAVPLGAAAGYVSVWIYKKLENRFPAGFEMVTKNCVIAVCGLVMCGGAVFLFQPVWLWVGECVTLGLNRIADSPMLFLSNVAIEPLKVVFLNNGLNHGVLVPLGMEQVKIAGKSVLFLLESNPGPGFGLLLALWMNDRADERRRHDLAAQMTMEFLGGIHEVYFPYVLSDLRFLVAVMAGGCVGSLCFVLMGAGLSGPVSPGSVLVMFLLSPLSGWPGILAGVLLSAAVSCIISLGILKGQKKEEERQETKEVVMEKKIRRIYVVCDAGLGSSAMGAALFRRKLKEAGITGVTVLAAAVDDIPAAVDFLVCQRDFFELRMKEREKELPETACVETLTSGAEYIRLIEQIKGRMENGDN